MDFDFKLPGAYSREQALQTIQSPALPTEDVEQRVRRALFSILARNQDDHVKNIGFVMDREGEWHLAPAFDAVCSDNPHGTRTSRHRMSLNGKRDGLTLRDPVAFGEFAGLRSGSAAGPRRLRVVIPASFTLPCLLPAECDGAGVGDCR
ncbi:MAG: HipA domain-containing protein [Rhodobacteraceae bacterium]|nr:HipA domain-containing protein [Paracoccaceae bacterium]